MKIKIACLLIMFSCSLQATDRLVLWERNYQRPAFLEIITQAMELTEQQYGNFEIVSSRPMEQGAAFAALSRETGLNVAVAATSKVREQAHQTIYIPIDKGLLGFRVCLVNPDDRHVFSGINTLADINRSRYSIGVGSHWPDRTVIEANGLKTIHSENYHGLFEMLHKQRFTCFLRSVNEIDAEILTHADMGLTDEQHVALLYPSADFIFVAKSETRLKQRLETGLRIALENGDFDKHFDKHYMTVLQKYNFFNRKLLFLKNQDMTENARQAINLYGLASFAN